MKISRIKLAEAIACTEYHMSGQVYDYNDFPHWKKLVYLIRADAVIKALMWLKEREARDESTDEERRESG